MMIRAVTRTRIAASDLSALSFEGAEGAVRVTDAGTGQTADAEPSQDGTYRLAVPALPRLLIVSWEVSGAEVSAQLDVVARRICTVDDVKAYKADQLGIAENRSDEEIAAAIDRAEEVIETECRRHLQPVMRTGYVDRGTCPDRRYRNMAMGEGGYQTDLLSIVRATVDGNPVAVSQVREGSDFLDVTSIPFGGHADLAFTCGLPLVPAEARDAVAALAALFLAPGTEPDNAVSASTDAGILNFVVGGVNGATSVPEVNALIKRWGLAGYRVG